MPETQLLRGATTLRAAILPFEFCKCGHRWRAYEPGWSACGGCYGSCENPLSVMISYSIKLLGASP